MSSCPHQAYQEQVHRAIARSPGSWEAEVFARDAHALQVLLSLDLEPAREVLNSCYRGHARGSKRRDPVSMLRTLLLAILMGEPSLNRWVGRLRGSWILRSLCGFFDEEDRGPGVGTLYDFLHRLHDGPRPVGEAAMRASVIERRASQSPQAAPSKRRAKTREKKKSKGKKGKTSLRKGKASAKKVAEEKAATEEAPMEEEIRTAVAMVKELRRAPEARNPNDLLERLTSLLFELVVRPSAERGLLGDLSSLVVGGDGSTLKTGAQGRGRRICEHNKFERCDCDRIYADPHARSGYDSHRKYYFYGYRFYELSVSVKGHDLPVALRIDPANLSDMVAGPRCIDQFRRTLRDRTGDTWKMGVVTLDAGHDAKAIYEWLGDYGIKPVIPLSGKSAGRVPGRPDLELSEKGIPLCEGGLEMAAWGSSGRNGSVNYICPLVKGGTCPLAPEEAPDWRCRPDLKYGPTVSVKTETDARIFPSIQRNSSSFNKYRRLRSGTERSNGMKKGVYKLLEAKHRRRSFWLIRLHLIAILQHARAWWPVSGASAYVSQLLEEVVPKQAA